jgi:uncharacterized protein YueI
MFSIDELLEIYAVFKICAEEKKKFVGSFSEDVNKIYEKNVVKYQEIASKALAIFRG